MMRAFAAIGFLALLCGPVFGQTAVTPSAFVIADVHLSPPRTTANFWVGPFKGEKYEIRQATMVDLIRTAYNINAEKVLGGPSWLEVDRYDVIAKTPPSTSLDNARAMLKTLLADRFTLVVHEDTKLLTQFTLTVAGKPKMTQAAGPGSGCQGVPQQPPEPGTVPMQVGACRGITMAAFADLLPRVGGGYVTSSVVDATGLTGAWDFEIRWHSRQLLGQAGPEAISLFDALEKQLGLKLVEQKIPQSALVVDRVNQKPSDNPPGAEAAFPPPPPPDFEVADVKPSPEGAPGPMARIQPTGLVSVSGMPLSLLIHLAWDLNPDSGLVDAPKWAEAAKFDIIARAFTSVAPTDQPPIEIDTIRLMLRRLLEDRFKLKTHMEDRPVSAYTLTASNPKLTKADPSSRTKCYEGPAPGAKDPRTANPINSRVLTCQNITMAAFAKELQLRANGYVRTPVLDATGLDGTWDLTVNFSPIGQFQPGRGGNAPVPAGGNAGGALSASDPNGALTLPEALSRQLGLKLELQKRPIAVLVVDHAEEKPTEN